MQKGEWLPFSLLFSFYILHFHSWGQAPSPLGQQFSLWDKWDEWDEWDEWRMIPCGLGHPKGWTPNLPDQPK